MTLREPGYYEFDRFANSTSDTQAAGEASITGLALNFVSRTSTRGVLVATSTQSLAPPLL